METTPQNGDISWGGQPVSTTLCSQPIEITKMTGPYFVVVELVNVWHCLTSLRCHNDMKVTNVSQNGQTFQAGELLQCSIYIYVYILIVILCYINGTCTESQSTSPTKEQIMSYRSDRQWWNQPPVTFRLALRKVALRGCAARGGADGKSWWQVKRFVDHNFSLVSQTLFEGSLTGNHNMNHNMNHYDI